MTARAMFARNRTLGPTLGLPATLGLIGGLIGCNTVNSTTEHTIAEERMARPAAIVVQEFAISPDAPEPPARPGGHAADGDAAQAASEFQKSLASHLVSEIQAMGLPAVGADAPLPPSGSVLSLEGSFDSVPAGDSADPAILDLAESWPDVVVDVEVYDTTQADDRLLQDLEFQISDTNPLIPPGEPADEPTVPGTGQAAPQHVISPAVRTKLERAARDGAAAIAKQLAPFFADQGWIAEPPAS